MSLQVWLPLNGNLNNQGLSNISITNYNSTIDNNGKIGKCYSFNGSNTTIALSNSTLNTNSDYSICLWAKCSNDSPIGCVFSCRQVANPEGRTIFLYGNKRFLFDEGDRWDITLSSINYNATNWTHYTFTKSGNTRKIYINGVLVATDYTAKTPKLSTMAFMGASQDTSTSANGNYLNGQINDYRIYDHCLSAKEVKEISKGLILHYKLDNNGVGNPNLLPNTGLADNGWGVNQSGATVSRTITDDGVTFNVTSKATSWFLYYHTLPSSVRNALKTNTIYTFSFEVKSTVDFNLNIQLLCPNGTNSMSNKVSTSIIGDNEWHKYSIPLTTISSFESLTQTDQYFYMNGGNVVSTVSFKNAKFEESSKATPWIPNSTDVMYSKLGLDKNIEYDCSGLGNDGTKLGTINIDSNSPRYNVSNYFTSGSWINCGQGAKVKDAITVSLWGKRIYGTSIISCTESGGWAFQNNLAYMGTGISSNNYLTCTLNQSEYSDENWHHIVLTYDGFVLKAYLDGNLKSQSSTLSTKTPIFYNTTNVICVGAEATSSSTSATANYVGNISDVRIYATALSADDIKELYQTSVSIDKYGNLYAYELTEE